MTAAPQKILLVRLSALGDVIQTLPILTRLRDTFPEATIGWAVDTDMAQAIEGHPSLDHIHRFKRNAWSRMVKDPRDWNIAAREFSDFLHEIRSIGYDVAVDAQGLAKTAVIPFLAGIPKRVGLAHGRELSNLFYTDTRVTRTEYFDTSILHADHMAALCTAIGCPPGPHRVEPPAPPQSADQKIDILLSAAFPNKEPIIAIAVATQWQSKDWPDKYWIELINLILADTTCNIVLVGAPSDAARVRRICNVVNPVLAPSRVFDLSGKTTIKEMYSLYKRVQFAIGCDSAPNHIAGAVATPHVFGIYGPTAYRRTAPVGSPDVHLFSTEGQLPCQPCHKKKCPLGTNECLERITPTQVFHELHQTISRYHREKRGADHPANAGSCAANCR